MSKRSKGKDGEGDVWQKPEMQALDALTKKILKVPKTQPETKVRAPGKKQRITDRREDA